MPGFDPAAYRAEQRRGEPSDRRAVAPDTDPSAALSAIREDIEATADVYDLDGAGKNSYPVSAAMVRHARVLVAALEAELALHRPIKYGTSTVCRRDRLSWPCLEVRAITTALTGEEGP